MPSEIEELAAQLVQSQQADAIVEDDNDAVGTDVPSEQPTPEPEGDAPSPEPEPEPESEPDPKAEESEWVERLRARGATEDEIQAFRAQFVPKSAFTKLRAKDREEVRAIRQAAEQMYQQNQYLVNKLLGVDGQAKAPGGPGALPQPNASANDPVEEILQRFGLDEANPQVAELLREYRKALLADVQQYRQQEMTQAQKQQMFQAALEEHRNLVVEEYGDEVNEYYMPVMQQLHMLGYPPEIQFEHAFKKLFPKAEARLRQQKQLQTQQKRAETRRNAPEGFASLPTRGPRIPRIRTEPDADPDSPSVLASRVLDEMARMRRGG